MLWFMRRPWMKRLQRNSTKWFGPSRESKALESLRRQNAFALRYGLTILTFAMNLLLASILITGSFFLLQYLSDTGALHVPGSEMPFGQ